ncbi:hypothetical protein BC937DRAFT_94370 [Endogone sp. FLAS-F59071]|nr:hypothetical protein BC937DRAFT_94370 [Endogone sp. FLAS-F59071]|eukprot:RUS20791.1 hypothetical protein BC937DRAFT_94370 [Endogone sp. FLAS-F59071]
MKAFVLSWQCAVTWPTIQQLFACLLSQTLAPPFLQYMAQTLFISVPEAASSPSTIQFKITVATTDGRSLPPNVTTPLFRSFPQINWLHSRLVFSLPDFVIPPLPDLLNASLLDDQDYVEQKRLQVERFLARVGRRSGFVADKDVRYFLSNEMSHTDVVDPKKSPVLGFLNQIIKPNYERGLRIYKSGELIEDDDQDEFQRAQTHILALESHLTTLFDHLKGVVKQRDLLGDQLSLVGDSVLEALGGAYLMGAGLKVDNAGRQHALDAKVRVLGKAMDEMSFVMLRQVSYLVEEGGKSDQKGKADVYYLGDVLQEYKKILDSIKVVMNTRTEKLADFVTTIKQRNKKCDKADKLKRRTSRDFADVQAAIAEEEKATEDAAAAKMSYTAARLNAARELTWLEDERSHGLARSLADHAHVAVRYERQKLEALEQALDTVRGIDDGSKSRESLPKRSASLPVVGTEGKWREGRVSWKEEEEEEEVEVDEVEGTRPRSAPEGMMGASFAVSPFARLGNEQGEWSGRPWAGAAEILNFGSLDVKGF